ncbi:uncharacterized protein PG998_007741 [Apiospora kogelbergensis]|uniref:uncharacterized protein n=1 Tax=Apiospora kogelbergensis TaxID=1337665 RepID=UPI0031303BDC
MYNSLTRIQNVFGFFTTVAFVVAAFIAASDFTYDRTPSAHVKTTNVQVVKGRPHYYSTKKEEYAIMKFSLDADLSSLFTWNTKQVFVYVTAEWTNPPSAKSPTAPSSGTPSSRPPSSDHLANIGPATMKKLRKSAAGKPVDPKRGLLSLKNQRPKYQITHPTGRIAETSDVRLRVHYNVQPWVGFLTWSQTEHDFGRWMRMKDGLSRAFTLPAVKRKDEGKKAKA